MQTPASILPPGCLAQFRVLDLSRILAGPWSTQNLADLGAEVIKVERPGGGDDTRTWGPPWVSDGAGHATTDAGYYLSTNRGKKSITVDIASHDGRQLILDLAKHCDVFVENYKVGDLKRYGLDYAALAAVNPRLVYCSITGFGQDGPYAQKPGYDFVFQGMGGLMSITGERDSEPGGGPQKVGIAVTDVLTGMYATVAILAALHHRNVSGRGQYIDMALLDCIVAFGGNQVVNYFVSGKIPPRYGNAHANLVPYEAFKAADGHLIIAVGNDQQWQRCCEALEATELAADSRFSTGPGRIAARAELVEKMRAVLAERNVAEWLERMESRGVPCGPINDYKQVFENPQVKHRKLRVDMVRSDGGAAPTIASPMKFSETPVQYALAPPLLGEHTDAVLSDLLGKDAEQIKRLRDAGVV